MPTRAQLTLGAAPWRGAQPTAGNYRCFEAHAVNSHLRLFSCCSLWPVRTAHRSRCGRSAAMDAKLAVELSRQWRNGAPASTLKAAGVLLHVIDGGMGGIFHNGFLNSSDGLPPPPEVLWERLERSVAEALSVSVVSRAYPHVYHPTNHETLRLGGFGSLPGVVLDAARSSTWGATTTSTRRAGGTRRRTRSASTSTRRRASSSAPSP